MADQPNLPEEELQNQQEVLTCDRCNDVVESNTDFYDVMGYHVEQWCERCADYYSFTCEDCGEVMSERNHNYYTMNQGTVCESCYNEYEWCGDCSELEIDCSCADTRIIHSYSYKPTPEFHWGKSETQVVRGTLFFGIELETECHGYAERNNIAQFLYDNSELENRFYLKEDGSLDHGIEIVSHPRTLTSWTEFSEFGELLTQLRAKDVRSWNTSTCGLHVHMSRSAFTNSHLMRFAMFFSRNEADIVLFAARVSSYAQFNPLKQGLANKVKGHGNGHFDALNLGHPGSPTVECRIFKPSLRIERVLGSIQFLAALYEYTKNLTTHDINAGALEWSKFLRFLDQPQYNFAYQMSQGVRFNTEQKVN